MTDTTTKPGVLAVIDRATDGLHIAHDFCGLEAAQEIGNELREARATVERLAEDAEAMLADLEADMAASPSSSYRMVSSGKRIAALRAALAAFRGQA